MDNAKVCTDCLVEDLAEKIIWAGDSLDIVEPEECQRSRHDGSTEDA